MDKTPNAMRKHVTIFGETNSGKSSLFNSILGTDTAIVSDISGTTTDTVSKAMELLPFGPILLTDTAGLNDNSLLGEQRIKKTLSFLERTDLAIYTIDLKNFSEEEYVVIKNKFGQQNIPHLLVFTKKDILDASEIEIFSKKYEDSLFVDVNDNDSIIVLKRKICQALEKQSDSEGQMINSIVPTGGVVVMVVPIDSEAPKGRLILPQVQLIRNCLDNGIRCLVTTYDHLKDMLNETKKIDLVVTDSQIFKQVSDIVPISIPLTSFSILIANQKGCLRELIDGVNQIKNLQSGDKILIAEVCTHNRSHEDIGRVKLPLALEKISGKKLDFSFSNGKDYPENLETFKLVVHCGGCMITAREMKNRIDKCISSNVYITNYGLVLALSANILDRGLETFR